MFNLFKRKAYIYAPVNGASKQIEDVEDEAFAQKMLGDGFAVTPESEYICAPCEGLLMQMFPTNHAFGIVTDDGLEVLVHIGIDTVTLQGQGFVRQIEPGNRVKVGDKIVKVDLDLVKEKKLNTDIIVVITNMDKIAKIDSSIGDFHVGDKVSKLILA